MQGYVRISPGHDLSGSTFQRFFFHAPNVHQGGGKSLLLALLSAIPDNIAISCQLDKRLSLPVNFQPNLHTRFVPPTLLHRFFAEWWLAKNAKAHDIVLCFGNLPPLFKTSAHVIVFVQNRYLIDDVVLTGFSYKTKLRLTLERLWLRFRLKNASEFVVQTPSMKNLLEVRTKGIATIRVLPFMANRDNYIREQAAREMSVGKTADFLYVASGEPHKNHRQLIEAWCLLAQEKHFPLLKLTLDKNSFPELCAWIERKIAQYQLNVENFGSLQQTQVKQLYTSSGALIYPSTFESFGLPLIEASQAGLPILASELDFVRDVLDPVQTFNPESAVSIAKAVKRFLGIKELPLPLLDAGGFITKILRRDE